MKLTSTIVKIVYLSWSGALTLLLTPAVVQANTAANHSWASSFQISQAQEDADALVKRILSQCIDNYDAQRYAEALEPCTILLKASQKLGLQKQAAISHFRLGGIYYHLNQNTNSIAAFEQAFLLSQILGLKQTEASSLVLLASLHEKQGSLGTAEKYYERALPVVRELRQQSTEGLILLMLGSINMKLSNDKKALTYHQQALPIFQAIKDEEKVAITKEGINLLNQKMR